MFGIFAFNLAARIPLGLDIIRDRGRLYRESWDGSIENTYTLRIMNMGQGSRRYAIRAEGEVPLQFSGDREVEIAGGSQVSIPISLMTAPGVRAASNSDVYFTVESVGDPNHVITETSRFLRPAEAGSDSGASAHE